jgi:hypothetical protein
VISSETSCQRRAEHSPRQLADGVHLRHGELRQRRALYDFGVTRAGAAVAIHVVLYLHARSRCQLQAAGLAVLMCS